MQYVKQLFTTCSDLKKKQQFCFILARHGITFELDEETCADEKEREALQEIINNTKLNEGYLALVRDIEVMEPKSPDDIYKDKLMTGSSETSSGGSSTSWLFNNKEHGKASAAASLALALLAEYVDKEDSSTRIGAIMGLGLAYAGSQNDEIHTKLTPILGDSN